MNTLRPATGTPIPRPVGVVRTSWSTDPFALGSYSFLAVEAEPVMREWLATPVGDRVFFAGEATDRDNPGTVHGALASGRRVAAEVLRTAGTGERVAVVGAGAAGAQTARLLVDAGHTVTLLEARDRIGGRLDTMRPDGWPVPVERGASWVHAIDTNDLADTLGGAGVASVPFDYAASILGADGVRVTDTDAFGAGVEDALEAALEWAGERTEDTSVADAVARSGAAGDVDPIALQHFFDSEISTEYGADPDEISAHWGFEEGSDGDDLLVTGGYGRLVELLLDGVDVRLGAPVLTIAHGAAGVEVTTGVAAEEVQRFDRIVVTVPLGVLKSGAIVFDPPLPDPHRRAIEMIGFGLLDKLWLRFDAPFWTDETLMWTIVDDDGYAEWFNLLPITGEPVLLALVGGERARSLRSLTDDAVVDTALRSLQKLADAGW